jgi:ribonuclease T
MSRRFRGFLPVAVDIESGVFREVRHALRAYGCTRAILVGHNASFDLAFLNEAIARTGIKRNPFHPFSSFDTATLCGVAYGQTVLSRAVQAAGLTWDESSAHSAAYDAEIAADLFCDVVNRFRPLFEALQPPGPAAAAVRVEVEVEVAEVQTAELSKR